MANKMNSKILKLTWLVLLLLGCTPGYTTKTVVNHTTTPTELSLQTASPTTYRSSTPNPTPTHTPSITPKPSKSPTATKTITPTDEPDLSWILLYYEDYAQVEIIDPSGLRILIDVANPDAISQPPTANDILLTTHHHFDHYLETFANSFPGQQLNREAGVIELPHGSITSIPSAHNSSDRLKDKGGTNYIFLIELGSLRIAHFGDIGQDQLTSEQLKTLLPVDIAITQLSNPFSDMNIDNLKGFRLMEQVNPRLIIPTHIDQETIQHASELWPGFYSHQISLRITSQDLSNRTQFLLLGSNARDYEETNQLKEWNSQD